MTERQSKAKKKSAKPAARKRASTTPRKRASTTPRKRAKAKSKARAKSKAHGDNGDPNLAQIRELIFGEQMTGYEERISALEKKLIDDVRALKATVQANLRELRKLMKERAKEVESASVPRDQIADSFEKLARTLRR